MLNNLEQGKQQISSGVLTKTLIFVNVQKVNPGLCRAGSILKFNSFIFVCARLYNCLPKDIRNFDATGCNSMAQFKGKLDGFLRLVPDEPRLDGYAGSSKSNSNSI